MVETNLKETNKEKIPRFNLHLSSGLKITDTIKRKNIISVPSLGLGTYKMIGDTCYNAVKIAILNGYSLIDTAEYYDNETQIGKAIKELIDNKIITRKNLFIISKVWYDHLRYDDVIDACLSSLKRLGTDYIDLYLIHWPNKNISMEETFEAFERLFHEGKIKYIGVSNFTIRHLKEAMAISKVPILFNEIEFHPFLYQKEILDFCNKNNIKIIAYSPIARGLVNENNLLIDIGKKYKKTPVQISLRWLYQHGIIAIPKGSSEEHIKENMNIFDFEISKEDMEKINNLPQKRLVNPEFAEF
ncbi:MAG: aldo/keto reductase [Candidatus Woesearchaeota archaeon]